MDTASANIAESISQALRGAAVPLSSVGAICMCLAGFDTDLDLPVPQRAMTVLGYGGPAITENDVVRARAGATEVRAGTVVIAGTGAPPLGMNGRAGPGPPPPSAYIPPPAPPPFPPAQSAPPSPL